MVLGACHASLMSEHEEYETQRQTAAMSLFERQGPDWGWGRTPDSASSLVNTAEVLNVIKAAGLESHSSALEAARFITRALPIHFAPRSADPSQPTRGQNLRYLSFGLDGLVTIPTVAFTPEGINAIRFCLDNIGAVQVRGAIPTKPGSETMSYHATARGLIATAKLLVTPGNEAVPNELLDAAHAMAQSTAAYLVREYDDESHAWTVDPNPGSPLSLSKTAIANTALGYYRLVDDRADYRELQRKTSDWLLGHYTRWLHGTSSDPQEKATDWSHLDYAECVRGLAAGRDGTWTVLRRSWSYMTRLWSKQDGLWTEPKGNPTIPAAYHTVMAFESVLPHTRTIVPPRLGVEPFGTLRNITFGPDSLITIEGTEGTVKVQLSPKQGEFIHALDMAKSGLTAKELAVEASVKANVISGYIGRLNNDVREKSGGAVSLLVEVVPGASREKIYRLLTRQGDS